MEAGARPHDGSERGALPGTSARQGLGLHRIPNHQTFEARQGLREAAAHVAATAPQLASGRKAHQRRRAPANNTAQGSGAPCLEPALARARGCAQGRGNHNKPQTWAARPSVQGWLHRPRCCHPQPHNGMWEYAPGRAARASLHQQGGQQSALAKARGCVAGLGNHTPPT